MKLGVMMPILSSMSFGDALAYLSRLGVQAVEVGTGGYPGNVHLKGLEAAEIKSLLTKYDIEISALACHGNPVHPKPAVAQQFHDDFMHTLEMAKMLGVGTIVTFSGCPGGCPSSTTPNWVSYARPAEWAEILDYQWNDVLIPYWKKAANKAEEHGIKVALEPHPNHCVHNHKTLLRLRDATGEVIGANFDPSHMVWQGIDPIWAIGELSGNIYHFHAKDIRVHKCGAWEFCSMGTGLSEHTWREMLKALKGAGYDGAISIEHSDAALPALEGLEKAITFVKQVI